MDVDSEEKSEGRSKTEKGEKSEKEGEEENKDGTGKEVRRFVWMFLQSVRSLLLFFLRDSFFSSLTHNMSVFSPSMSLQRKMKCFFPFIADRGLVSCVEFAVSSRCRLPSSIRDGFRRLLRGLKKVSRALSHSVSSVVSVSLLS
ncbi:Proteasome/cyclosome repeat-containing protein [Toxoplasma gondii TgCatPRC2]|uniref:Proteasome/cyclosome repeat-containing protein n=1 Tax=Toxoplasma gondii TgCatPRC2 TaxID=1130821 RepID=A0A151HMN0_TOXGO|nr:Proteasome/cyclosome repeat-containing protein [Toxoplasma gondii TgCatPRC2]